MNHIYKVVWSKVRGCYVVVAEIARSNGKTRSQKVVAVLGTALISSMLFTGGGLLTAEAAQGQAFGDSTTAPGANSIAAGNTTTASGQESIALGTHNTASGKWSVAFGGTSIQQTFRNHGKNYFVYQIGDKTYYKNGNDYFSTEDNTKFTGDASTATAVMVNAGNTASGDASVAFGQNTQAKSLGSVAFGMGTQAGAEDGKGGQNSIAFGNYTKALGGRSVAFGEYTIANYNDSVAFGNDTRALSTGATAFGNRTRALSSYSTAWGNATVAADEESTAWGSDTIAGAKLDDNGAVTNKYTENGTDKTEQMDVHGNLAYIQNGSTVGVKQMDIGGNTEKHDYVVLDGQDGNTYVRDYQGSLWRVTVSADGKTATVDTTVGDNGKVYNNNSKAGTVGSKATTTVNGTEVAITPDSVLKKAHEGSNGYNIDGYKDATAFGYSTEASGDYATAFGNDTQAKATGATTFGTTTKASGDNATAFGLSSTASGKQATAFGSSSTASGDNATAFGESSTASGEASTAFGISSTASGRNSLAALGGTASAENAAAIGNGAQATLIDSVALGSNSKTTRAKYSALTDAKEKAAYAKGSTSTGSAWEATDNAIAVGNDSTTTRQITGVAAGSLDTDAVNVAQLRAVDAKHTIVTVGGNSVTADNTPVNGGNLDLKRTTATNGQETYDLSLDKNVILGEQVENNGGKLTVNNVDKFKNYDKDGKPLPDTTVKEAVKIDGKTVSVVKHDGSAADNDQRQVVLGVDQDAGGYVALYDNTGKKPTYIYNAITPGATYLQDGNSYTPDNANEYGRLEYGDYHQGTIQFIATLDDGQKYAGDNYEAAKTETKTVDGKTTTTVTKEEQNVLLKKLNERLDIKGGATGALTDNNIGVNVKDDVMKVQLAQNLDLDDKGSVKMGDTTINNGGVTITTKDGNKTNTISLTENGLNNGGKTITNVGNGTNPTDAVNVSQLNAAKTTVTSKDHSVTITPDNDAADKHTNYDLKIATATLSPETTGSWDSAVATGKVTVTNPKISVTENGETKQVDNSNAYVTGNSVANAINNAGFKLTASKSEGEVTGNKETLIHPGDTMTIDAGKNISLTQTDSKISIATKDKLVLGKDTSDGKDGQEGTIGLTGKDGLPGADGKQGYSTTIIKTEKGQAGKDGKTGKENLGGTDITRIVYTDKDGSNPQTVATLSDGLKFAGDDMSTTVAKKLNETLQIRGDGTYDKTTQKTNADGNIQVSADTDTGTIKVALNKDINLEQNGSLTVGGDTQDGSKTGQDPIVIKHFDAGKLTVTGTDKNGNTPQSKAGDYVTGLDNKDWDVTNPTYVSGRAATEDQLKTISDTIKSNAETAAGQHTAVTVNDKDNETTAPVGTDGKYSSNYGSYSDSSKGNLLIAAKTKDGQTTYNIKLNDQLAIGQKGEPGVAGKDGKDGKVTVETSKGTTVVIGHDSEPGKDGKDGISVKGQDGNDGVTISVTNGKDGNDGSEGHIGLTGSKGADGKDGQNASADIHVKNGQVGVDGTDGNKGTNGMDRVVYEDHNHITHEVATMDDGLKFAGDDVNTTVAKKLNDTLQIRGDGTYDKEKNTVADDGNIKTSVDNGAVKVSLSDKINLHQDGYLTVGGDKNGNAADGNDPIVIKHFDDKTLDVITGVDKEGKPIIAKEGKAGDYVTGLDNKDWNVDSPTYVSGRAATEDQLKTISDAVKEAATTAGKHTVVTVENGKAAGTTDYNGENLKLKVTEKDGQKTYDLKLNDKVTLGKAGKDGIDGSIRLTGADGKSSIGLNGKDGISVIGKDGQNGVSITGSTGKDGIDGKIAIGTPGKDGQPGKDAVSISGKDGVGHIGLTGQKGADGKDGAFTDLSTILGTATLDRNQNEVKDKADSTKDQASRIQYQTTVKDADGTTRTITHEVATMDDGLKFVGNDGKEVAKKLNSTLSLTGGMDKDAVAKASSKNLGVRSNAEGDGLELVMTDTPDFTKVTVGEGTDTTQKIIIGKQTVTGKKSDGIAGTAETGKYITGLDNTKWNKDNVVENRAATEGQLRDIAGSITNQTQGGGFGLADEAGNTVKKDLGQTVTVKGDGKNIETKVVNGSLEVSLKKDVDLGGNGSINAGQTKVDQNGVDTNKVTIKDSGISISKDGINGGGKQITNIASGIDGKTYADAQDNNAASIGDVKNIAGKVEQNVTNVTENVNQIGQHVDKIQTDVTQLQQDVKADRQYQGDDAATKKSVNVKFGRFLSLTGGAKIDALADEGNLGVIQQEREDPDHKGEKLTGLSIRLAKDLKGLNSVEANTVNAKTVNSETFQAGNTTINNGGLTVKGDDKHKDITVQQGSVNMGGNKIEGVAPGKVAPDSTEAVNGSQLAQRDQAIGKLGGEVSSLDRRVDRVGAGAAALAALHPQDFDPDDKWDFAVGYGNYRGANAAAVGAFYRPNEDTTLSVGGTVGGGENMVNAGISFKFGQGNHVTNSRVAMAKELLALKDYVQKQDEKIEKLEALVGQQGTAAAPKRRSILFPDVPENHWAYAYVKKLADRGLLEGYPDGEFKGDRTITRYEFAAIFSRALENGASVDGDMERMSEEFEPEIRELSLNRFRVDRVEGKDNDRHKIERVRVNDRDELVKQKNGEQKKRYRDLYGSVIEKDTPADAAK